MTYRIRNLGKYGLRRLAILAVTPAYVADLEAGRRSPGGELKERIAAALDISPENLAAADTRLSADLRDWIEERPPLTAVLRSLHASPNSDRLIQRLGRFISRRSQAQPAKGFLITWESELRAMAAEASAWSIETGGDLFGRWHDLPTVLLATKAGPAAQRDNTHFRLDVDYLRQLSEVMAADWALRYFGDWHSHHRLLLAAAGQTKAVGMLMVDRVVASSPVSGRKSGNFSRCRQLECASVTTTLNQQIHLASRPKGEATTGNFRRVEAPLPPLADGQVLVRHHFLSLDPYMRGRMDEARSYAPPQALDAVMIGGTAGEVVESQHPGFAPGDLVVGMGGWQQFSIVSGSARGALRKVDTTHIPLSAYLGAVGMPGVTAWHGLTKICQPKPGDTITVSAASGAVGSVVGQLAKARGYRAVGFAGGADKCRYVTGELGFDACIDYKAHGDPKSLYKALAEATPNGVDGHFENVGGPILDAVLARMNDFGRIAVCGMISGYNGEPIPLTHPALILRSRLRIEGFIVSEHMESWPDALTELGGMVATGKLKYRESIAIGLEAAPEAFLGLLKGKNFGKQLVQLV